MSYSWFLQRNGEEEGPLSSARIAEMARDGILRPDEYVRRSDMEKWVPAGKVKGLAFRAAGGSAVSAQPVGQTLDEVQTSDGRRVVLLSDGTWKYKTLALPAPSNVAQPAPSAGRPATPIPTGPHFRRASWGMSELEVRDSEDQEPIRERPNVLVFAGRVAGLPCDFIYIFVADQLVRTKYIFTVEHSYDNDFIQDYDSLKTLLKEKYGLPVSRNGKQSEQLWTNDLYQDDPEDWGMAISMGHLMYCSNWSTPDTDIFLMLTGDNYEIELLIEYTSKSHAEMEDETTQQRHLEDL
jgi:hypothetical protein